MEPKSTQRTFYWHFCISYVFILQNDVMPFPFFIIAGKMELEYVISKKLQLKMKAEVCYKEKALISKLLFLFITIFFILSYKNDTMDETVY